MSERHILLLHCMQFALISLMILCLYMTHFHSVFPTNTCSSASQPQRLMSLFKYKFYIKNTLKSFLFWGQCLISDSTFFVFETPWKRSDSEADVSWPEWIHKATLFASYLPHVLQFALLGLICHLQLPHPQLQLLLLGLLLQPQLSALLSSFAVWCRSALTQQSHGGLNSWEMNIT